MGRKRHTGADSFDDAFMNYALSFNMYRDILVEIAISSFTWKNVPEMIDTRFMELTAFYEGRVLLFKDDIMGYLSLQFTDSGRLDFYRNPTKRRAYAINGYQAELDSNNSVILYNNMLRLPGFPTIRMFAARLANYDITCDINVNAQKTPVLLTGSESQQLTLRNLYQKYAGNIPVIFGDKNLDLESLKVLKTDAPFTADKIYDLKTKIWNEALTYLGISNVTVQKKERMVTDEVMRGQGGTLANRASRLKARVQACEEFNKMFGTDMSVEFDDSQVLKEMERYMLVAAEKNGETGGGEDIE